MKTILITLILLAAPPALSAQPAGELVSNRAADAEAQILDVKAAPDGSVTATIRNETGGVMKDVKVLVTHTWHWKDERRPGRDNPGRSSYVAVPGEIAPKGTVPFSYRPEPPLPARADGSFETTVRLQGFTQVGD